MRLQPSTQEIVASNLEIVALIPAYRPGQALEDVIRELAGSTLFAEIVVIDDGSGPQYRGLFDRLLRFDRVRVLRHAVNLGKGAALKTGINCALVEYPELAGAVTADADGQHDPADIATVAKRFMQSPHALIMGTRTFAAGIPWRSRLGNTITSKAMRLAVGHNLSDTQTGLRAIPRGLLERLLRVPASGYEFEVEMLIAARHPALEVVEQPIQTIYQPGNPTSHFQPWRDSMRIYFVLLRFGFISLITAGLDNLAFYLFFSASGAVPLSLVSARILALMFNYSLVRKAVFHSHERHEVVLPRYLAVGAVYLCVSYALFTTLAKILALNVVPAKIMAESFLFIINFVVQRDFVFARRSAEKAVP